MIQVCPAEDHRALDASLAARGYRLLGRTLVHAAPVGTVIAATRSTILVEKVDDRTLWPRLFGELDSRADSIEIIARITAPTAFMTVSAAGRPVGMGLFVADSGWAGVFSMATHPGHRQQGIATAILGAGARWAAGGGADSLYLQVEEHNRSWPLRTRRLRRITHLSLPESSPDRREWTGARLNGLDAGMCRPHGDSRASSRRHRQQRPPDRR